MIKYDIYGRTSTAEYEIVEIGKRIPIQITSIDCSAKDLFNKMLKYRILSTTYARKIKIFEYSKDNYLWEKYFPTGEKFIKTIESEIRINTGDCICINGKDYAATYIYDLEKDRHELHLNDYIVERTENKELKEHAEKVWAELLELIDEYNQKLENPFNKLKEETSKVNNQEEKNLTEKEEHKKSFFKRLKERIFKDD